MPKLDILDTFPAFETFWEKSRNLPISEQIDLWEKEYLGAWPELLAKQKECYAQDGLDWRAVARTRVFPHIEKRLTRMRALHADLLRTLPGSWTRTKQFLHIRFPVRFVVYVGAGCGAGWATTYGGQSACLFGLENAAQSHDGRDGWSRRVVAHEVAHLAHQAWRKERWEELDDPWWKVYEEGFATYCERRIEPRAFPLLTGRRDWLLWCDKHRAWLAKKFLRDIGARRSVRPFFGSWYNIRGYVETGYYLGSEVIREWARTLALQEIARIPESEIRERVRTILRRFAEGA